MPPTRICMIALLTLVLAGGCAGLERALQDSKPRVSIEGMRLAAVDFERARVVFDVAIDNPNPVGLDLAGFDYAFSLGGNEFLSGRRERALRLPADDTETIAVPLTIPFARIAQLPGHLSGRANVDYDLELGLDLDLPAVGRQRFGVATSGTLPVPQRPDISLKGVRIAELGFAGAELVLELGVDNPNAFGIELERFDYALAINGRRWAGNRHTRGLALAPEADTTVELPLAVHFDAIGTGAYELLQGGARADYRLTADIAGRAGLDGFGAFDLPLERSGRIDLVR